MPTTPARAKYLKRRRAKLKKLKEAEETISGVINEWLYGTNIIGRGDQWCGVIDSFEYIMRQARKAL